MQITMSMSQQVCVDKIDFNEELLRDSLKTLIVYSEKEAENGNEIFAEQVICFFITFLRE